MAKQQQRGSLSWITQSLGRRRRLSVASITSKIKHAIKHKTSPARLAQLLHNRCSPH